MLADDREAFRFSEPPLQAPIPVGRVLTAPVRLVLPEIGEGCFRVFFTLDTRHFSTAIPNNELFSHRLELTWLVYSASTGRLITLISQSEATYRHPDIYVNLPEDGELIMVPMSPYICNSEDPVTAKLFRTLFAPHAYRYEFELGSPLDAGVIEDRWSYREGRLSFMNFFNNKAFRWAFDGAELRLPVSPGRDHRVRLNALLRTEVAVEIGGEIVAEFPRSCDGVRWHDEDLGFTIPARLATEDSVTVRFVFQDDFWRHIDFNLRQEGFAVSKFSVDVFGEKDESLPERVGATFWANDPAAERLQANLFDRSAVQSSATQMSILISDEEFALLEVYISPTQHFWNTLVGLMHGALSCGGSISLGALSEASLHESVVIGPLRFDTRSAKAAAEWVQSGEGSEPGLVLAMTTASLRLCGLPVDDRVVSAFAYRELYYFPFEPPHLSNFWEMIITTDYFWREAVVAVYENVLVGRSSDRRGLILASGCAEDWLENGSTDSLYVLKQFFAALLGPAYLSANGTPCSVSFKGEGAMIEWFDDRRPMRSCGGGIARGWKTFQGPSPELPPLQAKVCLKHPIQLDGAWGKQFARLAEKFTAEEAVVVTAGSPVYVTLA